MFRRCTTALAALFSATLLAATLNAGDWPTYQHDNRRSAVTDESLPVEHLVPYWVYRSPQPPQPAWPGPAKWDAYAGLRGLRSMRNYDPVFHVIAAGGAVYFGSSADDSVYCLDGDTGEPRWIVTTGGPVRIAPTYSDGRVYFGSDDGYAYCVDANSGEQVWRFSPAPQENLILHNGRFVPFWPCRTGVMVEGGTAYFGHALLPWKDGYISAVDAAAGEPTGEGRFVQQLPRVTIEGAMLASPTHLFVPQGRVPPRVYDRKDGQELGSLKGGGGSFVLLTHDDRVLHGPGNKDGWITDSEAGTRTEVASYQGGNAIVVAAGTAYLLTDYSLAAIDRNSRQEKWNVACDFPYTLILAGDTLFAGGDDAVAAFSTEDGREIWRADVEGRAFGLAVAEGALYASTDEGRIHAFRPARVAVAQRERPADQQVAVTAETVPAMDDPALLGRWVFSPGGIKGRVVHDQAGRADATILGRRSFRQVDEFQALVLDGSTTSAMISRNPATAPLPKEAMTAEAWVRIDQPQPWGGIIGCVQDNGDDEHGWILGFVESRLAFGLRAKGGDDRITYVKSQSDFVPEQWYHVLGTYDGRELRLYVNGQLQETSTAQQGSIDYPARGFYEIGAYHDDDEYFRTLGMLHEVRVYDRALSAEEAAANAGRLRAATIEHARLARGPYLEFTGPDSAVVRWWTDEPSPSILEFGFQERLARIEDATPQTEHTATLSGLGPNRVYWYTITVGDGDGDNARRTRPFECDTNFNYTQPSIADAPHPYGDHESAEYLAVLAQRILDRAGVDQGLCLVYGCGDGRLAFEIARQSNLRVIGVDTDPHKIAAARDALVKAGVYGARIRLHHVDRLEALPLTGAVANLVVCEAPLETDRYAAHVREVGRMLRPDGGVALILRAEKDVSPAADDLIAALDAASLDCETLRDDATVWLRAVRPPLDGAGEWSHQYGLPDNAAFGGETLGGATGIDDLEVQWFGLPGPRAQPDRNGRKPSPLAVGGRLFVQGLHRVAALDAYNGTILWAQEIPPLARFNMPRDCGNWCADREHVYTAIEGECWKIDAASGAVESLLPVAIDEPSQYDWGYVARHGDLLLGSAVRAGTSYTSFWGGAGAGWYDATDGPITDKVASDNLFALDAASGRRRWEYRDGPILNSTITVGGRHVYFVEARHPAVRAAGSRRVGQDELWHELYLVALEVESGSKLWEQHLATAMGRVVYYLAHGGDRLAIVASGGKKYYVYAFDDATGEPQWQADFDWKSDNHGAHMSRPAIVGDVLYVRPKAFDLTTGSLLDIEMPGGHGCGTYACTSGAVILRSGNLTVWDRTSGNATRWHRLRPDCWLSSIPAGGLLLSPEGGGGCSCGSWIETSLGFAPRAVREGTAP